MTDNTQLKQINDSLTDIKKILLLKNNVKSSWDYEVNRNYDDYALFGSSKGDSILSYIFFGGAILIMLVSIYRYYKLTR